MSNKLWFWQLMNGTKSIPGFEGRYSIDRQGNVYSHNYKKSGKTRLLRVYLSNDYKSVTLYDKQHTIHRLLAMTFLEEYSNDLHVDHIDGNKVNNNLSNLRMVTPQENQFNQKKAKGCYFDKIAGRWKAQICVDQIRKHIGYYDTQEEASDAYLKAKKKYHIISKKKLRVK